MNEFPFATVSFQTPMSSIFKRQQVGDIWKHIVVLTVGGGLANNMDLFVTAGVSDSAPPSHERRVEAKEFVI